RARREVDDLAAEDRNHLHDLAARRGVGRDLEQRELARDRLGRLEVADLDHVDELVQLLGDLVDRVHRAVQGQRDPRQRRIVRRTHGQRVDVEPAAGEKARNARQNARLVLDQDPEDVLAAGPDARGSLELLERQRLLGSGLAHQPTISRAAVPGAIIGYVFSSRVTLTSTTTGPGVARASRRSATKDVLSFKSTPVAP